MGLESRLAGIRPAEGTFYLAKKNGQWIAFGRNVKQEEIQFDMKTQAAADERKPS